MGYWYCKIPIPWVPQNNSFKEHEHYAEQGQYIFVWYPAIVFAPANVASGANSNNTYQNITIKMCIMVFGSMRRPPVLIQAYPSGTSPDNGNTLNSAACGRYNVIGDPTTPNDMGNGTATVWGISAFNQANLTIANTRLRNLTSTGSGSRVDGIFISNNSLANAVGARPPRSTITNCSLSGKPVLPVVR